MELVIVYIRLVHPIGMTTDLLSSKKKNKINEPKILAQHLFSLNEMSHISQ